MGVKKTSIYNTSELEIFLRLFKRKTIAVPKRLPTYVNSIIFLLYLSAIEHSIEIYRFEMRWNNEFQYFIASHYSTIYYFICAVKAYMDAMRGAALSDFDVAQGEMRLIDIDENDDEKLPLVFITYCYLFFKVFKTFRNIRILKLSTKFELTSLDVWFLVFSLILMYLILSVF